MNLDELVVRLVLDPKGFVEGGKQATNALGKFKDETKKTSDDIETQAAKMADGFSRVTKELLGLGLAIVGASGLKDLVVGTVRATDEQGRLARSLDISTEAMSRWVNASRLAGTSKAGATSAISEAITTLGGIATHQINPTQAGLEALQALGITNPNYGDWEKYFLEAITALQKQQKPGVRASLARTMPGGGDFLLNLANEPGGQLVKDLQRAASLTDAQAEASRRLTRAITDLSIAIETRLSQLIPLAEPRAKQLIEGTKTVVGGDASGLLAIDQALGGDQTVGAMRSLSDAFFRLIFKPTGEQVWPGGVNPYLYNPDSDTFNDRFGSFPPPQLRDRFGNFPLPQERPRILPPPGGEKIPDRLHGNITGSTDNSKSVTNHITNNLVTPPNATPQMLSGLIGSAVVQATIGVA